jgi:hypothetical protein
MDFGVFTSGGDGSPNGVFTSGGDGSPKGYVLVACSLSLKKLKLLFFEICLIIRYRVKIYL